MSLPVLSSRMVWGILTTVAQLLVDRRAAHMQQPAVGRKVMGAAAGAMDVA